MSSSRNIVALRFGLVSTLSRVAGMVCALLQVRLVSGYLPSEEFGIWSLTTGLIIFSAFLDLGVSLGMQNRMSLALARNDRAAEAKLLLHGGLFLASMAILSILGALVLSWSGRYDLLFGKMTPVASAYAPTSLAVGCMVVAVNLVCAPALRYLTASPRNWLAPVCQTGMQLLALLGLFLCIRAQGPVQSIFWFSVAHVLAGPMVLTCIACARIRLDIKQFEWSELRKLSSDGFLLSVPQVCSALYTQFPSLVLAHGAGLVQVGNFSYYQKYSAAVTGVVLSGLTALWPSYANASALGDQAWIRKTYVRSLILSCIGGVLAILLTVLAGKELFFILYGAKGIVPETGTLWLTGTWIGSSLLGGALASYLNGTSKYGKSMQIALLNGVLLVVLTIYLVPLWGLNGALAAMLASHASVVCYFVFRSTVF